MSAWAMVLTVLGLARLIAGADAAQPAFSISLNVTGWSPFMTTDLVWNVDIATGAVTSNESTWRTSTFGGTNILRATGTKFQPFGTVEDSAPGTVRTPGNFSYFYRRGRDFGDFFTTWKLLQPFPEVGRLANPGSIELGTYTVRIHHLANTTVTIDYFLLDVPVLTSA